MKTSKEALPGKLIKFLVRFGNSNALVIPKSVLDLLEIDKYTPLLITTDGKSLFIEPVKEKV